MKALILTSIIMMMLSIIMLLVSIPKLPYVYYIVLRFIISITSILALLLFVISIILEVASEYYGKDFYLFDTTMEDVIETYLGGMITPLFVRIICSILLLGGAILFNPVVPFYLPKGIWVFIDLVVALLFVGIITCGDVEIIGIILITWCMIMLWTSGIWKDGIWGIVVSVCGTGMGILVIIGYLFGGDDFDDLR